MSGIIPINLGEPMHGVDYKALQKLKLISTSIYKSLLQIITY